MKSASKIRIEIDSLPTEIDEVDRRVMQLEIELSIADKETDEASAEHRAAIERGAGLKENLGGDEGAVAEREGRDQEGIFTQGAPRAGAHRSRARTTRRRPQGASKLLYTNIPKLGES